MYSPNLLFFNIRSTFSLFYFPAWSQQTSGMHQLVVWTALKEEGLGTSLQHYNPLLDPKVRI